MFQFDPLLARDLCKYFFQVVDLTSRRKSTQTKEEQAVYSNLLHIFSLKLLDRFNRLEITSKEDSVESWLEFTYQLSRLTDTDSLGKVFHVLATILLKANARLDDYVKLCFSMVQKWVAELAKSNVPESTQIVESFSMVVQMVLAVVLDMKDLMGYVTPMVDCIAKIQAWCPESHGALAILESSLLLSQTLQNQNGAAHPPKDYLNRLVGHVAEQPPKMSSVRPIVHILLYKSRRNLTVANVIQSDVFSLLMSLYEHTSQSNEPQLKKTKKILEIVYIGFTALNRATKETLEEKFNVAKTFVKLFCKAAAQADRTSTHFSAGGEQHTNFLLIGVLNSEITAICAIWMIRCFLVISTLCPFFCSSCRIAECYERV